MKLDPVSRAPKELGMHNFQYMCRRRREKGKLVAREEMKKENNYGDLSQRIQHVVRNFSFNVEYFSYSSNSMRKITQEDVRYRVEIRARKLRMDK